MPVDEQALVGALSGIAASLITSGIAYGIMKEKLRRLEDDFHELKTDLREDQKTYVTMKHFDAVIEPMKQALSTMQRDVKEILRGVSDLFSATRNQS